MTDPITCPECGGTGQQALDTLRLACRFCLGRGEVGGDYEPAEGGHIRTDGFRNPTEGESYDPAVHGPLPPVQDHPAVRDLPLCTQCMGSGEVINFGADMCSQAPRTLLKAPCPRCRPRD